MRVLISRIEVPILTSLKVDEHQAKTGQDVKIHVDAASGGFVAPFAYPTFKWAFDVPRVVSINTSGHKFGLVYPGLGWILWRDEQFLHKDLIFELRKNSYRNYIFFLLFFNVRLPRFDRIFLHAELLKAGSPHCGPNV